MRSNTALPIKTSFGASLWSNTMTARDLRDAGTSKPQSLNASSMPTERTITSYRTEEPVSDDVSLDLDDTDDPVARTLDYEGLSA